MANLIHIGFCVGVGLAAYGIAVLVIRFFERWLKLSRYLAPEYSLLKKLHLWLPVFFVALSMSFLFSPSGVSDAIRVKLEQLARVITLFSATLLLIRMASIAQVVLEHFLNVESTDNLRFRRIRTQIQYIFRTGMIAIAVIGFSAILMVFPAARQFGASLIASAGVVSVVIGFGAQRSLSNLIAGFQIAFTQPIRIDDVVVVEKEWGRIEEITLTYVVIRIWDLRRLIVPITYFIEKPFENWTRNSSTILGSVFLNLDFTVPVEPVRKEARRLVEASPLWDKDVCVIQVTDAVERSLQIRILMSSRNSGESWDLRCQVREGLLRYLREHYPEAFPTVRATVQKAEATFGDLSVLSPTEQAG